LHAADLDLAIAAPWLPSLVRGVSGSAAFDVELRGGRLEPEISGQLTVASATFDVPTLGQKLGPLEAKIRLEDHAVSIDTLSLAGGRGAAKLSGMLELAGTTPVAADLTLDFLGFEVRHRQDLTGQLDGSLRIEGPLHGIGVRGTVALNDGRIRLTDQRSPLVREIRVTQMQNAPTTSIREGEPAKLDLFDNATLDVRLQVPRDTWIVGQGAHVEIEGVIEAHKRPRQPVLALGGLDVVQGNYRLQGRMFQIEQGHALFSGRTDFDPVLDALATTRVNDVKILATVGGTASAPTLRLESDPPHTQNDVLALLLFGRTSDSLAQPEASGLSSFAAAAAGSALLNQIGGAAGPHLPVDAFTVGAADQSSGTTIGAGRYVTQDVYVHYDHDIGGSSGGRIRVDWRLTKQFSVESRTSSDGNASADLIWTYDY